MENYNSCNSDSSFLQNKTIFYSFCRRFLNEFNSNVIINGSKYAIVEADEYDRSFLNLNPKIGLITSIDSDHLDVYGNFEEVKKSFNKFIKKLLTKFSKQRFRNKWNNI